MRTLVRQGNRRHRLLSSVVHPLRWLLGFSIFVALLSGLASLWLFSNDWCPWLQDFLLNLSFTFFGILITVALVESLQRRHEEQQWSAVAEAVRHYVDRMGYMVMSAYSRAFEFQPERDRLYSQAGDDADAQRRAMIGLAEGLLLGHVERVAGMDEQGWRQLHEHLVAAHNEASRAIALFGARMTPEVMNHILQLQRRLESVSTAIRLQEGVLGVPLDALPNDAWQPPDVLQQLAHEQARQGATQAIEAAIALLRAS